MYGYQKEIESNGSEGKYNFGLNNNVVMKNFSFNPNKNGYEAIDIIFTIGDKDFNYTVFPFKPFTEEKLQQELKLYNANITQIMECFISEKTLQEALNKPIDNFKIFAETLVALLKNVDYTKVKLDVFLQYQSQFGKNQTQTYLEVPKNVKHGRWVCPTMGTGFSPRENSKSLHYVKGDAEHIFVRSEWFMTSDFSKKQNSEASNKENKTVNMYSSNTSSSSESWD